MISKPTDTGVAAFKRRLLVVKAMIGAHVGLDLFAAFADVVGNSVFGDGAVCGEFISKTS